MESLLEQDVQTAKTKRQKRTRVPEFAWFGRTRGADRGVVGADGLEPPTYAV
jgi:hypothetical protein